MCNEKYHVVEVSVILHSIHWKIWARFAWYCSVLFDCHMIYLRDLLDVM